MMDEGMATQARLAGLKTDSEWLRTGMSYRCWPASQGLKLKLISAIGVGHDEGIRFDVDIVFHRL